MAKDLLNAIQYINNKTTDDIIDMSKSVLTRDILEEWMNRVVGPRRYTRSNLRHKKLDNHMDKYENLYCKSLYLEPAYIRSMIERGYGIENLVGDSVLAKTTRNVISTSTAPFFNKNKGLSLPNKNLIGVDFNMVLNESGLPNLLSVTKNDILTGFTNIEIVADKMLGLINDRIDGLNAYSMTDFIPPLYYYENIHNTSGDYTVNKRGLMDLDYDYLYTVYDMKEDGYRYGIINSNDTEQSRTIAFTNTAPDLRFGIDKRYYMPEHLEQEAFQIKLDTMKFIHNDESYDYTTAQYEVPDINSKLKSLLGAMNGEVSNINTNPKVHAFTTPSEEENSVPSEYSDDVYSTLYNNVLSKIKTLTAQIRHNYRFTKDPKVTMNDINKLTDPDYEDYMTRIYPHYNDPRRTKSNNHINTIKAILRNLINKNDRGSKKQVASVVRVLENDRVYRDFLFVPEYNKSEIPTNKNGIWNDLRTLLNYEPIVEVGSETINDWYKWLYEAGLTRRKTSEASSWRDHPNSKDTKITGFMPTLLYNKIDDVLSISDSWMEAFSGGFSSRMTTDEFTNTFKTRIPHLIHIDSSFYNYDNIYPYDYVDEKPNWNYPVIFYNKSNPTIFQNVFSADFVKNEINTHPELKTFVDNHNNEKKKIMKLPEYKEAEKLAKEGKQFTWSKNLKYYTTRSIRRPDNTASILMYDVFPSGRSETYNKYVLYKRKYRGEICDVGIYSGYTSYVPKLMDTDMQTIYESTVAKLRDTGLAYTWSESDGSGSDRKTRYYGKSYIGPKTPYFSILKNNYVLNKPTIVNNSTFTTELNANNLSKVWKDYDSSTLSESFIRVDKAVLCSSLIPLANSGAYAVSGNIGNSVDNASTSNDGLRLVSAWTAYTTDITDGDRTSYTASRMNYHNQWGVYYKFKYDGDYLVEVKLDFTDRQQFEERNNNDSDRHHGYYFYPIEPNNGYYGKRRVGNTYDSENIEWQNDPITLNIRVSVVNGRIDKNAVTLEWGSMPTNNNFTNRSWYQDTLTRIKERFKYWVNDNHLWMNALYAIYSYDDSGGWNEWQFVHVIPPFKVKKI